MNIALVASSYLPHAGGLERHVDELARGLTRRGVQVEVLAQEPPRRPPPVSESDGFVVRRFIASIGSARFAVAPGLWEHLRRTASSFDLVHAHCDHPAMGLAVARAHPRRLVFTPHAPIQRMLRWPYARVTRAVVEHAALIICTSQVESDLLCGRFPEAAERIRVVPKGLDVRAIRAAEPFAASGRIVLAVGRLERYKRVDRSIAAMASLEPSFSLVVIGDGPNHHRLVAHADDLQVSPRVRFLGSLADAELYRWLGTASVTVALAEQHASGTQVTEALAAGAPVVASDIPVHREAAAHADGAGVIFVSPEGSPLEVADAVSRAALIRVPFSARPVPAWDAVADRTLALYEALIHGGPGSTGVPSDVLEQLLA